MMINENVENSSLMMMVVCLFHFFGFWIIIIIEGKKQQQSSLYKIQSMDFFPEKNCFVFFLEKLFFSFLFGLCNYVIIIRFLFVERCLRINVSRKMKNKKLFFSHWSIEKFLQVFWIFQKCFLFLLFVSKIQSIKFSLIFLTFWH